MLDVGFIWRSLCPFDYLTHHTKQLLFALNRSSFKGTTKLYFTHYSCAVIILFNTGLSKSAFSTYLFRKLVVLSYCTFCVYILCIECDVIFLNFNNICIIIVYIVCVWCFCSQLLEAICKGVIKIWSQSLTKNMPPGSFWVLKTSFIMRNVDIHKMKECKKNAINKYFFSRKFKAWKIQFGPLLLAALKCYCWDNGHKMQTSFKTLVWKNTATWRLHQTSG